MRRVIGRSWLFIALLLGLQGLPASAQPASTTKDLVDLPAGRVYEVLVDADKNEPAVWIALDRRDHETADDLIVSARPIDVSFGNRHDTALIMAFTATLHLGNSLTMASSQVQVSGPGIELRTRLAALQGPGTYDVYLRLARMESRETQLVKVQVVVPAAVLQVRRPVVVERIMGLGSVETIAPPILIAETGQKSCAAISTSASTTTETPDNAPVDGRISAGRPEKWLVPAGHVAELQIAIEGAFPLGTVKGTMELAAPQLAAPASVQYEVRTRRRKDFIVLLISLGLIFGYVTRTLLKRRLEIDAKILELQELRERIAVEVANQPDEKFQEATQKVLKQLDEMQTRDAAKIAQELTKAEQSFTKAQEDLDARCDKLQDQLDERMKQMAADWPAPKKILNILHRRKEELTAVKTALESRDAVLAERRLADLEKPSFDELSGEIALWRGRIEKEFAKLKRNLPLDGEDRATLDAQIAEFSKTLEELHKSEQAGELGALIAQARKTHLYLLALLPKVHQYVSGVIEQIKRALTYTRIDTLQLDVLSSQLKVPPQRDSALALSSELDDLQSLSKRLEGLLIEPLRESVAGIPPDLLKLFGERRYVEFAQRFAAERGEAEAPLGPMPFGEHVPTPIAPAADASSTPESQGESPSEVVSAGARAARPARRTPARRVVTPASLAVMRGVQFALAGIGITAIGYLLFEAKFVGTAQELITIFFWGFTIDVSVDALVESITKSVKRA